MRTIFAKVALGGAIVAGAVLAAVVAPAASPTQAQENNANIRVIHGSPDAPAVDIYVNGAKAISNLAFKEATDWTPLPAGTYAVKVTAAGGTDAVIEASLPLESGKYYTVLATGKLADISAKVLVDDLSTLAPGKARLRVVHASPDAPAVDVAVKGGPVLVSNLSYPNSTDYLTVDKMTVDVEIRAAGTETVALAVPGFALEEGKSYSVYALGLLNGAPALTVLPTADNAVTSAMFKAGMPNTGGEGFGLVALILLMTAALSITGGLALRASRAQVR